MFSSKKNCIRSCVAAVLALWAGYKLTPWWPHMIIGVVVAFFIGWLFTELWKIKSRWGLGIVVSALITYEFAFMRAIHELMIQGQPIITNLVKLVGAALPVTLFMFVIWVPLWLLFVLVDVIVSKSQGSDPA